MTANGLAADLDLPSAWPPALVAMVRCRHTLLLERCTGTVLDLGDPGTRERVLADDVTAPDQASYQQASYHQASYQQASYHQASYQQASYQQASYQHASFQHVVSPAALVHVPDLPDAIRTLTARLAPGGRLHLIEPIGRPGWRGLVSASVGDALHRWLPAVDGLHLGRDLAATVRAEGLTIVSIERFDMSTSVWPLRPWMQASAARITPSPEPGGTVEP